MKCSPAASKSLRLPAFRGKNFQEDPCMLCNKSFRGGPWGKRPFCKWGSPHAPTPTHKAFQRKIAFVWGYTQKGGASSACAALYEPGQKLCKPLKTWFPKAAPRGTAHGHAGERHVLSISGNNALPKTIPSADQANPRTRAKPHASFAAGVRLRGRPGKST